MAAPFKHIECSPKGFLVRRKTYRDRLDSVDAFSDGASPIRIAKSDASVDKMFASAGRTVGTSIVNCTLECSRLLSGSYRDNLVVDYTIGYACSDKRVREFRLKLIATAVMAEQKLQKVKQIAEF